MEPYGTLVHKIVLHHMLDENGPLTNIYSMNFCFKQVVQRS